MTFKPARFLLLNEVPFKGSFAIVGIPVQLIATRIATGQIEISVAIDVGRGDPKRVAVFVGDEMLRKRRSRRRGFLIGGHEQHAEQQNGQRAQRHEWFLSSVSRATNQIDPTAVHHHQ